MNPSLEIQIQKARQFNQLFQLFEDSVENMLECYFLDYEFFSSTFFDRNVIENLHRTSQQNRAQAFIDESERRRHRLDNEISMKIDKILEMLNRFSSSKEIIELKIATRKISHTLTSNSSSKL